MESFTIRLAGQYFTICPVCDYIREYCKDYIVADVKRGTATEVGGTAAESTPGNTVACATEVTGLFLDCHNPVGYRL